jgi:hypothetical protein
MHDDLSVFSDETLTALHEDLLGALDDGVATARTAHLLRLVRLEQGKRHPANVCRCNNCRFEREAVTVVWEAIPFRFIPIGDPECQCFYCRNPGESYDSR